jgi:hypothetical protein
MPKPVSTFGSHAIERLMFCCELPTLYETQYRQLKAEILESPLCSNKALADTKH